MIDPGTALLISSLVGGGLSFLSGATNPQQRLDSFEGHGANDPNTMLTNLQNQIGLLQGRVAGQPISLPSATMQSPPTFAGGGLPMPIGVQGKDPMAGLVPTLDPMRGPVGMPKDALSAGLGSPVLDGVDRAGGGPRHAPAGDGSGRAYPLDVSRVGPEAASAGADDYQTALQALRLLKV